MSKNFMLKAACLSGAILLAHAALAQNLSATLEGEPVAVFEEKTEGYAGYRIPAIIQAADGSLLAFAEARKHDKSDAGDIDLVMRRSEDGGRTWGPLEVIFDDGANTCGNPAPVVLGKKGEIVLLACWNLGEDKEYAIERRKSKDTRRVYVIRSHDHGRTWDSPEEITETAKRPEWTWYATGPCHAIVKRKAPHKGRIVVPCDFKDLGDAGEIICRSHVIYSDDKGKTWSIGAISQEGGNESTVAETSDGQLVLNMRHTSGKDSLRLYAFSSDGGESWTSTGEFKDLVEPICQGSMVSVTDRRGRPSRTLLFSNPSHSRNRVNMSLSVSHDDGRSWSRLLTVDEGPSAYSDLVMLGTDEAGLLYEAGTRHPYDGIFFTRIRLTE